MNIGFLTVNNKEVVDSEVIVLDLEMDIVKCLKGHKRTTVKVSDDYFLPAGEHTVYDISSAYISSLVDKLSEADIGDTDIKDIKLFYSVLDIIEQDYFNGLVVY